MFAQACHEVFGQVQPLGAAQAAHAGRAFTVGRQVQRRQLRIEAGQPVVHLLLQGVALQEAVVPEGEVTIVDGQRRQRAVGARIGQLVLVEPRHFLIQQVEGPAVPDDVVRHEEPDVPVFGQTEHAGAEQRGAVQRDRFLRQRVDGLAQRLLLGLAGQVRQVHGREERHVQAVEHGLLRHALVVGADDGAQDRLALAELVEGTLEGGLVHLAGEAVGRRGVVDRGARGDRFEEVQALLHQRQRRVLAVFPAGEGVGPGEDGIGRVAGAGMRCASVTGTRRVVGRPSGRREMSSGRRGICREGTGGSPCGRAGACMAAGVCAEGRGGGRRAGSRCAGGQGGLQPVGQLMGGGGLEEGGQRDLQAVLAPQGLQQLRTQQRVTATGKEVVFGMQVRQAQVLGHQLPDPVEVRGCSGRGVTPGRDALAGMGTLA